MSIPRVAAANTLGLLALLALSLVPLYAADTNKPQAAQAPGAAGHDPQLQMQWRDLQRMLERDRAASAAAAEQARMLSNQLELLAGRQAAEAAGMEHTNRLALAMAGAVALAGLSGALLGMYLHTRSVHRLVQMMAVSGPIRSLGAMAPAAGVELDERQLISDQAVEQSNRRLLGFIGYLEKRIGELEQVARPPLNGAKTSAPGQAQAVPVPEPGVERVATLLEKGQSLLNADRVQDALACFEEVVALAPGHAEALVKKGCALERLRKPQEAIECYDRAIAADSSMTVAYLYKGGLCNRLERFSDAMQCYEQALRSQGRKHAG